MKNFAYYDKALQILSDDGLVPHSEKDVLEVFRACL